MKNNNTTKKLTYCSMFTAMATVLMYLEVPLPFMPPFLKLDISGVVSLLAAFMFGWAPAVLITLAKDLIHLPGSTTGGVGQLADFLMISSFSIIASVTYRKMHTRTGAMIGLGLGTLSMGVIGVLTNKYMLIPFFTKVMPIEAIIEVSSAINPLIGSIDGYLFFGALPFNLLKGVILTAITLLLYKKLSVFINQNTMKDIGKSKFIIDKV